MWDPSDAVRGAKGEGVSLLWNESAESKIIVCNLSEMDMFGRKDELSCF